MASEAKRARRRRNRQRKRARAAKPKMISRKNANKQRRGQRQVQVSTKAPTLGELQEGVQNMTLTPQRLGDPYLDCRISPYSSKGGMGIPDGRNHKYIVVDHFVADTIVVSSSNGFTILTTPTLPATAAIRGGGADAAVELTINGNSYKNGFTTNPGLNSWYPLGVPAEWAGTDTFPGQGFGNDPYTSASARCVSVQRRLLYLSSAVNATGIIAVTPMKLGLSVGPTTTLAATTPTANNIVGALYADSTQTSLTACKVGTQILSGDMGYNTSVFTRDTVTTRVENGVTVIGKHYGEVFRILPTVDNPYLLSIDAPSAASSSGGTQVACFWCGTTVAGNSKNTGVVWYDDDWEGTQIVVTGNVTGATFRLETVVCMEYSLQTTSAFAPLSIQNSPERVGVVRKVDRVVNALPVAVPGGQWQAYL